MALAGLCWLGCAGNIPEPGESHLRYAESHHMPADLEMLREGRRLMVFKCDGCHSVPRVLSRRATPETWPGIMDSMRVEAKLTLGQDSLIRNYLLVASGQLRDSLAFRRAGKTSASQ